VSSIPVGNVYYLLLYAWNHLDRRDLIDVGVAGHTDLLNLFARALSTEVSHLISKGLARDYVAANDEIAGIRGKLDLGTTLKRNLLRQARTYCHFDELQYDIPRNRIIKGTLRLLLRVSGLDSTNRQTLRRLHSKLDAVADVPLRRSDFRAIQSHRLMRDYEFVLHLCQLIVDSVILDSSDGTARFSDFREDEQRMWKLFEDFVFNFYSIKRPHWLPRKRQIDWFEKCGSVEDLALLPVMQTDVFLSLGHRQLVLDAKFYKEALTERFGRERVRSNNLYQLFAYVDNLTAADATTRYDGMLLYPVVEKPFSMDYRLKGHRIAIRSIDLSQAWEGIEDDMLRLVEAN
jgi:5-methylcytosine-specific restriction enzyme subunit McrC